MTMSALNSHSSILKPNRIKSGKSSSSSSSSTVNVSAKVSEYRKVSDQIKSFFSAKFETNCPVYFLEEYETADGEAPP
jgi:hypothetical protein